MSLLIDLITGGPASAPACSCVGPCSCSKRSDPTAGSHFLLVISGSPIGYFSKVSGLTAEYEVFNYQEGGQNGYQHRLRGPAKYTDLTLVRGITNQGALLNWFRSCQESTQRHEGYISLLRLDTAVIRTWSFEGAYPVKWEGPNMSSSSTDVATETLVIAHRGIRPE